MIFHQHGKPGKSPNMFFLHFLANFWGVVSDNLKLIPKSLMSRIRKGFKVLHGQLLLRRGDQNLHHLIPVAPPAHHDFIESSKLHPFSLAPVWRVTPFSRVATYPNPRGPSCDFFSRLKTGWNFPGDDRWFRDTATIFAGKNMGVPKLKLEVALFCFKKSYPPRNGTITYPLFKGNFLSRWFSEIPKVGYGSFLEGILLMLRKNVFSSKN